MICAECPFVLRAEPRSDIVREVHVTVRPTNVSKFLIACDALGAQAHRLVNMHLHRRPVSDWFTSKTVASPEEGDAHDEIERQVARLRKGNMTVVRRKIETVPWDPVAMAYRQGGGCYFETHLRVGPGVHSLEDLIRLAHQNSARVSISTNRPREPSVTLRADSDLETFRATIASLRRNLEEQGYGILKQTMEFAMHDSNPAHDKEWMT